MPRQKFRREQIQVAAPTHVNRYNDDKFGILKQVPEGTTMRPKVFKIPCDKFC